MKRLGSWPRFSKLSTPEGSFYECCNKMRDYTLIEKTVKHPTHICHLDKSEVYLLSVTKNEKDKSKIT